MSNNNTTTKKTTFWKFLTDNTIEIPIIQRDYAQGRDGKEHLRKNFLSDLKDALDKGEELKLDFVYGSKENNKLNPLDGQQRLTTLWLLHWYIALRSGNLNDDVCEKLKRFTYETRISSREFCKELCKTKNFQNYYFGNIVEYIKKQTWFYSAWKQDPTIQSMLRMLGGTKNEKGEPNNDGIEQVFKCNECGKDNTENEKQCNYDKYWNILTENKKCPIIFYYLPLNEFKLTDDLYIKMNARGEQLTSFENFKADLIGYITKQKDNENFSKGEREKWESLLDKENGIPIKMDTDWTNIFWKNKSQDYKIDEIYFAFLNRFFLNCHISKIDDDKDAGYKYLTGDDKGENAIVYKALSDYYFDDKIELDLFTQLKTILNNYYNSKIDESSDILRHDKTWNEKFYFIPKYNEEKATEIECKNKIYTITQKERVAFYAICKYFNSNPVELIDGKLDYTSLKRWMRVVWNIISVQTADGRDLIRNVAEMKNAIELIDKIEEPHSVYENLSRLKPSDFSGSLLKDQFAEEIEKAKQILNENGNLRIYNEKYTWEDRIKKTESYAFFKGAIRFLFTDGNGEINWEDFDAKWENAQKYFDRDGVKNSDGDRSIFIKLLLCISEFKLLYEFYYDDSIKNWRQHILLNSNLAKCVNDLLLDSEPADRTIWPDSQQAVFSDLTESDFLLGIPEDFELDKQSDKYLLTKKGKGNGQENKKYFIGIIRNHLLSNLFGGNITVEKNNEQKIFTDQKNTKCDFFWGWNINFKYHNHFFQWYGNPQDNNPNNDGRNELDVYLMIENWDDYCPRKVTTSDKKTENGTHYCFKVTDNNPSLFTDALDSLINEAIKNGDLQSIAEQ